MHLASASGPQTLEIFSSTTMASTVGTRTVFIRRQNICENIMRCLGGEGASLNMKSIYVSYIPCTQEDNVCHTDCKPSQEFRRGIYRWRHGTVQEVLDFEAV